MVKKELKRKSPMRFENAPTKDYKLNPDKTISKKKRSSNSTSHSNPTAPTRENAAKLSTPHTTHAATSPPTSSSGGVVGHIPTVTEASRKEKFGMSKVGQAVGGLVEGFNMEGGDPRDVNALQGAGMIAGNLAGLIPISPAGKHNALRNVLSQSIAAKGSKVVNSIKGLRAGTPAETYFKGVIGLTPNAATVGKIRDFVSKTLAQFGKPQYVAGGIVAAVGLSLGGKAFGDAFVGTEEAHQGAGFVKSKAYDYAVDTDDWSLFDEAVALEEETLEDNTFWEEFKSYLPWKNVLDGVDNYVDSATQTLDIWKKLAENKKNMPEGSSAAEEWAIARQQQNEEEKALIDYYNEERRKLMEFEEEARRNAREEEAAFWEKQRKQRIKDEEAAMKKQADFWLEYKKLQLKIQEDASPSRLSFGLL